ncbi:keratin-associated protein 13-1-like [Sorex araneus]|uniref:keratin-associated protein 13-1-like n=1 Tax=Sorex araneus TaxID=42254 RepID=UPI002433FBD3|nr:keratin-associated protein 13-1-like [Sorex araneus]
MSYGCYSGNYSSSSFGSCLQYPGSFCGSSYTSSPACGTGFGSSGTCPMGSSVYGGSQEMCSKPIGFQASCGGMPISSQSACSRPRPSTFCGPCQPGYGSGVSSSSCSQGYGAGSSFMMGCGSSGFKPCGGSGFPSVSCGSGFSRPSYLPSKPCQSSCYRPTCGF